MELKFMRMAFEALSDNGEAKTADEIAGSIAAFFAFGDIDVDIIEAFNGELAAKAGEPIMMLDGESEEWVNLVDNSGAVITYPTVSEWYAKPKAYRYVRHAARNALYTAANRARA